MGTQRYITTREITVEECPWLLSDIPANAILYACVKWTYGCISPGGVAMTLNSDGDYPFFEVPRNAVKSYD